MGGWVFEWFGYLQGVKAGLGGLVFGFFSKRGVGVLEDGFYVCKVLYLVLVEVYS